MTAAPVPGIVAPDWRVFLDESGDHTYRKVADPQTRYLGLTAVVVRKAHYGSVIVPDLDALKRAHFKYDPDDPVILHRTDIVKFKGPFGVLQDPTRRAKWADDLIVFFDKLDAQVFTVVVDKDEHKRKFPGVPLFDPYAYSLSVLLWRIRGFLTLKSARADVLGVGLNYKF